ncbi:hypothetical protein FSP39_007925 [Pinctada imbricata]|uniref:Uncharacterized protein n=1 Tax=Pinctada imbricata TaxID=66713 RepID=A0AA88XQP7_PINIB|nr:hypothetical protein FSP39_007925 [Pinctada imbricata]
MYVFVMSVMVRFEYFEPFELFENSKLKSFIYIDIVKELYPNYKRPEGMNDGEYEVIKKAVTKYHIDPNLIRNGNHVIEMIRYSLERNYSLPILTLFTTWASDPEKYECHNNTVLNWMSFYPIIQPVIFTTEKNLTKEVTNKGWLALPVRKAGRLNKLPVLRTMFSDVKKIVKSKFYSYSNSDILFTGNLIHTLFTIMTYNFTSKDVILIIGQRTNIFNVTKQEASAWETIRTVAQSRGKIYLSWAIDYFISSDNYPWDRIPDVVVGRPAFDNWIVWYTKKKNYTTIDATATLLAVHQTTKAGNLEGHHHPDRLYNRKVIGKHYKRVRWSTGITSCATNVTIYSQKYGINILKRPLKRSCKP